ncbi:MAG: hypothetical protein KAG56_03315 [Sulfurovaceae bacterium]|nr:hypothetical protein [Sulfurovaceae bacterium]
MEELKADISFINGYLFSMSNFCHGCDYVPFYGAEEVMIVDNAVKASLVNLLGEGGFNNFKKIKKSILPSLLNKWLGEKFLEGEALKNGISLRFLLRRHNDYLLEFIEDIVSSTSVLYSFNIKHKNYEMETEALCFHGNNKCIFIYFGWSD